MFAKIKTKIGLFIIKYLYVILKYLKVDIENLSDGYYTFKELYNYRMLYNALYFNELALIGIPDYNFDNPELIMETITKYNVHKSFRHNDGELCFGGGWFIVVAVLPTGQISNHYEEKYWDLFKIPAVEKSTVLYDNHTPKDVEKRIENYIKKNEEIYEIQFAI